MITPCIPHSYLASRALTVQAMKAGMSQNVACPMSSAVLVEDGRVLCFTTVSIEKNAGKMRSNYQLLYLFGVFYISSIIYQHKRMGFLCHQCAIRPKSLQSSHPAIAPSLRLAHGQGVLLILLSTTCLAVLLRAHRPTIRLIVIWRW